MSIVLQGSTSGSVTLQEPAVAGTTVLDLPATSGTVALTSQLLSSPSAVGQIPFSTDGSTYTPTAKIVSGTAVASTSGTSIDFTSIPSWVKRITVMYQGVSTDGTSDFWLRLGTSGGFATSGYTGYNLRDAGSGNSYNALSSAFIVTAGGALASELFSGNIVITNQTGNVWIATGQVTGSANTGNFNNLAGYISLSGVLTQVRLTSATPNTFDAGTINILYE